MAEPRRLPNGRFAKVINVPEKRGKPFQKAGGGYVIIRTNAGAARMELAQVRSRMPADLLSAAEQRGANIQARMRGAALIQYNKASTGRFGRGINVRVSKSKEGDKDTTVLRVTAMNYREANFLTNIGGSGYFKRFPVGPYTIWASGARDASEIVNSELGIIGYRKPKIVQRLEGVGRLKVPRKGKFFSAARQPGRGGGESRTINNARGPIQAGDKQKDFFFYPIKVEHPGFGRDFISEIAQEEGAAFVNVAKGMVTAAHSGIKSDSVMVVSREIPISALKITSSRGSITSRGSFS